MSVALLPSTLPQNMTAVRLTGSIPSYDLHSGDILFVDPTGTPEAGDLAVAEHEDGRKVIAIYGGSNVPLADATTGDLQPEYERDRWKVTGLVFAHFHRLKKR